MDRIFLLGGNIQLTLEANTGVPASQFQVQNQPAIVVKNWDLLSPTQQQAIINLLSPLGFVAAN